MKKLYFFFCLIVPNLLGYGQFNLEKTIVSNTILNVFYDKNDVAYYYSNTYDTLKIYNPDFTLYRNIPIIKFPGYSLSNIRYPSFNLFIADDDLEYICNYYNSSLPEPNQLTKLYSEDGTLLMDFGSSGFVNVYQSDKDNYKLEVFKHSSINVIVDSVVINDTVRYITNTQEIFVTEIYGLPGEKQQQVGTDITLKKFDDKSLNAFPNPTSSYINLPYKIETQEKVLLSVYSINGNLMVQKLVEGSNSQFTLDVSRFKPGIYLYNYKNISKQFVVR